jgi:hypothetical protein
VRDGKDAETPAIDVARIGVTHKAIGRSEEKATRTSLQVRRERTNLSAVGANYFPTMLWMFAVSGRFVEEIIT